MDLKVKQDKYNPLLKRKELAVEVEHEKAGSPSRVSLREAVASKVSTKIENVFVLDIETRTGSQTSMCTVQVYDDPETAKATVPKYIQTRNLPSEERKKLKAAKAEEKAKAPKAEKPKAPEKPKAEAPKAEAKAEAKPQQPQKEAKEVKDKPEAPKGKEKPAQGETK